MTRRTRLTFSEEEQQALHQQRFEHPDPRVQQRMEVLWLISQGLTYAEAARLAGVAAATADRYVALYRQGGLAALREFKWCKPTSALQDHRDSLDESFRRQPVHTVAEACQRIKDETGIERRPTQVRAFLKVLGLKWRCLGAIPLPPKKTIEEHAASQAEFLETKLEPLLAAAQTGTGHVFFVDAAHFVMGAFLCAVWCRVRLFIRGGSGRQRYSVLGAWNAVSNELVSITTDATVNAATMSALLVKIAALGLQGPITLVLDNARYQHCALVIALANSLNIQLQFLPSYSPNLNLIERLWKFTKKQVLYGRHYGTFAEFCAAIDGCLAKIPTEHRAPLKSLMTHNFQTFDPASFQAA